MLSSTSSDTTKNRIKELEQALHEEIIKNKRHSEEKAELICTIHKLNAELREANELCEVLKANSYRVQNNVVTPLQIEVGEWVREYQCLIEELYRTKKTSVSLMEDLQFEREINECLICLLEEHKSEINSIKAQVQSEQIKIYSTRRNSLSDTVSGHISFVDALARLALEKKQRDRVEASLKELISENGSLSLELDLLTEKLSISAQRIDNLKKGINDEQQTYRIFKDKMEVELEELRGKMLDARKDSVHWRLKYDRLLTTKEASGNSHDESLNTLRTIPTNSKIGERRQSGGSDLCQSVSQQNAGFFQQTLLDGFKKDVITEGVVIRCTSASFNSNCMPNMGKLEGVVQTLIAEEKENGGDNGCDASHNLYQRTFN